MRIWTRKSASIQPRTSLRKSDCVVGEIGSCEAQVVAEQQAGKTTNKQTYKQLAADLELRQNFFKLLRGCADLVFLCFKPSVVRYLPKGRECTCSGMFLQRVHRQLFPRKTGQPRWLTTDGKFFSAFFATVAIWLLRLPSDETLFCIRLQSRSFSSSSSVSFAGVHFRSALLTRADKES